MEIVGVLIEKYEDENVPELSSEWWAAQPLRRFNRVEKTPQRRTLFT